MLCTLYLPQVKDDIEPSILTQSDETGAIQVEYKLHELPDGQVAAVPAIPMALKSGEEGQNRVSQH